MIDLKAGIAWGGRMKRILRILISLLIVLMAATAQAGGRGGGHGGGGWHGGGGSGWHGGGHGGWHGGHSHGDGHFGVFIGPGFWGWPGYWGPYPYPYAPYYGPPAVVQQPSEIYVQPEPQTDDQQYWYFCQDPQGYYPYVKQCPKGWQKVVPSPGSGPKEGEG